MRIRRALGTLFAVGLAVSSKGCSINPEPLLESEIDARASAIVVNIDGDQEPISGSIDLYQAMARALKYNLDHRVEMMEAALRAKELDLKHFDMLPGLVSNSGYAERDRFSASKSVEILPGDREGPESLRTSASQEKQIWTSDVTFSWHVLDFGLSYVRARQAADKFLIAQELRRKVAHRVIEDVRTAYWRAVSADRLLSKLRNLEHRVVQVQKTSRSISADRQTSPITAVTYERELVEIKRTIEEIQRDLIVARTQLASLMNLRPGTKFSLVHPKRSTHDFSPNLNVKELVWEALTNRAELRELWYQRRINEQELDAALLELLPGLQMYAGTNFDSNDFLLNSNWLSWGAKASWNAMRVFQYPRRREVIEAQDDLLKERGLAIAMAVMTQVHVSRVRFLHLRKELKTATEYLDVQRRLVELLREEAKADRVSEQNLIREEMNALVAETKRDIAYAGLQNAFANVYASTGADSSPPELVGAMSVRELAAALKSMWIERGDLSRRTGQWTASVTK